MHPHLLRHLWQVIEQTPTSALLQQADTVLIDELIDELTLHQALSRQEYQLVKRYLQSHLTLVRDFADARLSPLPSVAA